MIVGRVYAVASDLIDYFAENGDRVAIAEAEYRVQVHGGPTFGHQAPNDALYCVLLKQLLRDLQHCMARGALSHPDEDDTLPDGHNIAALDR